jgi:hypothetical protein
MLYSLITLDDGENAASGMASTQTASRTVKLETHPFCAVTVNVTS